MNENTSEIIEETSDNNQKKSPFNFSPIKKILLPFLIAFIFFVSGAIIGRLYSLNYTSCPQCPEVEDNTPKPTDYMVEENSTNNQSYPSYQTPLHPAFTENWELYISKVNNLLFLYPTGFIKESSADVLYDPIILKNSDTQGEIIVQRLEDITDDAKSQEYEAFLSDIGSSVRLEKYGYLINPTVDDPSPTTNPAETYGFTEQNIDNGKIYHSIYLRHDGWFESIVIRTNNVSLTELRAINESFKFLRN